MQLQLELKYLVHTALVALSLRDLASLVVV